MGVSLDALLSVKLKVASNPEADDAVKKQAASTPEVVRARRRLKQVQKPASPLETSSQSLDEPADRGEAEIATQVHQVSAVRVSGARKMPSPRKRPRPTTSQPSWTDRALLKPVPPQRRVLSPLAAGQENARCNTSTRPLTIKADLAQATEQQVACTAPSQVADAISMREDGFFQYMWGI